MMIFQWEKGGGIYRNIPKLGKPIINNFYFVNVIVKNKSGGNSGF